MEVFGIIVTICAGIYAIYKVLNLLFNKAKTAFVSEITTELKDISKEILIIKSNLKDIKEDVKIIQKDATKILIEQEKQGVKIEHLQKEVFE